MHSQLASQTDKREMDTVGRTQTEHSDHDYNARSREETSVTATVHSLSIYTDQAANRNHLQCSLQRVVKQRISAPVKAVQTVITVSAATVVDLHSIVVPRQAVQCRACGRPWIIEQIHERSSFR